MIWNINSISATFDRSFGDDAAEQLLDFIQRPRQPPQLRPIAHPNRPAAQTRSLSPLADHNDPKLAAKEWQRLPGHSRKND
jgi:hypothetical protein